MDHATTCNDLAYTNDDDANSPKDLSATRPCATSAGLPSVVPPGCPPGPPLARPFYAVARAPADEIIGWLESAIARFVDANPTALQIDGDCLSPLRWSALQTMATTRFGHLSKELSTVVRDHAFLLLLKLMNPAQHSAWVFTGVHDRRVGAGAAG